jgi:hypothetical protein
MAGAADVGYGLQRERWQSVGSKLDISPPGEPSRTAFDIDAITQEFIIPIQLVYERPGVLKVIAQAFNRGKFQEKLCADIRNGLAQARPYIRSAILSAWEDAEDRWLQLAQAGADNWLKNKTGANRTDTADQLQSLQHKLSNLEKWQASLLEISPVRTLDSWQMQLKQQAVDCLIKRVQTELKR